MTLTWSGLTQGLHTFLQTLIDAEATQHIGADPFQRTDTRTTHRNGTPGQGRLPGGFTTWNMSITSPGHLRMALVRQALLTVQQQSASRTVSGVRDSAVNATWVVPQRDPLAKTIGPAATAAPDHRLLFDGLRNGTDPWCAQSRPATLRWRYLERRALNIAPVF